jgi:2-hydroxycyclohexanecarboxyl-CoA dehydrogenase
MIVQNDILKLADKSVVLAGPFCSYTFDVVSSLCKEGASVVLLTPDHASAQRICQVINDDREIHEDYGRAFPLAYSLDKDAPEKIIADAAHTFRGLDIYIDNMNWHESSKAEKNPITLQKSMRRNFELSKQLATAALPFLVSRKKGKMVFMMDGFAMEPTLQTDYAKARGPLCDWIHKIGIENRRCYLNINGLQIELSEDFLLRHFPERTLKESLAVLKQDHPDLEITRTEVISKFVTLLACDLTQGVTGQVFKLNV